MGGDPDVSYAGDRVVLTGGLATSFFPNDDDTASAVVVRDVAGVPTLAATTTAGVRANGTTERPAISADGHVVAFEAPAGTTNLAPDDSGAANDVYVRNLVADTSPPRATRRGPRAPASPTSPAMAGAWCSKRARGTTPPTTRTC